MSGGHSVRGGGIMPGRHNVRDSMSSGVCRLSVKSALGSSRELSLLILHFYTQLGFTDEGLTYVSLFVTITPSRVYRGFNTMKFKSCATESERQ